MAINTEEVTPRSISAAKLVAVEGIEEVKFLCALKNSLGISGIDVRDVAGKYGLPAKLRALVKTPGFSNVVSLGIMRDANSNAQSAFESVCGALKDASLLFPTQPLMLTNRIQDKPQVIVLILPHGSEQGMLEDTCLQSVAGDAAMPCVEQYFECLTKNIDKLPNNLSKARVHAFLSSREKPDLRLGNGAEAGYWPWDNQAFDHIKQFLSML